MKIPRHIGIIMDGNGRWAQRKGLPRVMGHRAGTSATREIVKACGELGVEYLTVYVFSAENWGRPKREVSFLMNLLVEMTQKEIKNLKAQNVRLHAIGDMERLPQKNRAILDNAIRVTSSNDGLNLILAVSYGGRLEILHAVRECMRDAIAAPQLIDSFDERDFTSKLYTAAFPEPELIIRTGGDTRISNFLLWQAAYAELYFTPTLWPDFNREALSAAIEDYSSRERRFGKVKHPK